MHVHHCLSGGFGDVDSDVEAIGVEAVLDDCLDVVQEEPATVLDVHAQVEVAGGVDFGDDEGVAGGDGILVIDGKGHGGFGDDLAVEVGPAEGARIGRP